MKKYVWMPRIPMNLQLFADPANPNPADPAADPADPAADPAQEPSDGAKEGAEGKHLTQEEVDKLISSVVARERARAEKQVEEARTEAEKLAKMTAEQKAQHEREKRERELEAKERDITRRELRAQALETLAEKGLPKRLASILSYESAEACSTSIEDVEKEFRAAVQEGVEARMKGKPPKTGEPGVQTNVSAIFGNTGQK